MLCSRPKNRVQILVVANNVQCKGPLLCREEECGLGNYEGVQHGLIIRLAQGFRGATLAAKIFCVNIGFTPTQPTENDTYEVAVPDVDGRRCPESGSQCSL